MKKLLLTIFIFIRVVYSQSFIASVNNNPVTVSEPFEVSFTFEGRDINSLQNFLAPNFGNLKVISGPNHSTRMQIVNGNVTASKTFSYYLVAVSEGKYTIGSATVEYADQKFKTEPIYITAIKGSPKTKEDNKTEQVNLKEISENLFIRAVVDKNKAYIGEQITVTYKLYTRLNIVDQMAISKLPNYVGFWAEELETASNLSFSTEVVNGKKFNVAVLKKAALFPAQSGKLEITPFELNIPIAVRRNRNLDDFWENFFSNPFNRQDVFEYNAKSNIVKIDVFPLPEENKPENFNGAVGKFQISANIDKENLKVNEPINLKVTISGQGNITLLQLPNFDFPAGLEKFESKVSDNINKISKISGSKTYEFLLIPRASGIREINPIEFSYFDPSVKKYFTVKTAGFEIKIQPQDSIIASNNVEKENIQILDNDIRAIKLDIENLTEGENILVNKYYFWLMFLIPVLLFSAILYWHNYNKEIRSNIKTFNYLRAEKIAKRRLKKALKYLLQNQVQKFYTEIAQSFYGYLENKLDIPKSEFTLDLAYNTLLNLGVNEQLAARMKFTGEKFEFIRFAPNADSNSSMKDFYDEVLNVIIEIEKGLNK